MWRPAALHACLNSSVGSAFSTQYMTFHCGIVTLKLTGGNGAQRHFCPVQRLVYARHGHELMG
ncbi:MAG: hypothetical protein ACJAWL_003411 [Motiliproteus sp.]|jgi:hypothetical protein